MIKKFISPLKSSARPCVDSAGFFKKAYIFTTTRFFSLDDHRSENKRSTYVTEKNPPNEKFAKDGPTLFTKAKESFEKGISQSVLEEGKENDAFLSDQSPATTVTVQTKNDCMSSGYLKSDRCFSLLNRLYFSTDKREMSVILVLLSKEKGIKNHTEDLFPQVRALVSEGLSGSDSASFMTLLSKFVEI